MAKLPPRRVPSDDFATDVDGVDVYPHAGEWVEVAPFVPVSSGRVLQRTRNLSVRLDALRDDQGNFTDEGDAAASDLVVEHYAEICSLLAGLVWGWNWTDQRGEPLPQPDGTAAPLEDLSAAEMYYLYKVVRRTNPAEQKNA